MPYTCLVCGYPKLQESPRSASGGGSYEICPSCGFQYGVDDDDRGLTPAKARVQWIKAGMPWSSAGIRKPAKWNPESQLAAVKPTPSRPAPAKSAKTGVTPKRPIPKR